MATVYLVGAGPGAPDLLTLRAVKLLEKADIVFYDALIDPRTLGFCPQATQIAVGKRCGKHSVTQAEINEHLVKAAQSHEHVVRLKGGDPTVFARAQEEIDALKAAGIDFEIVPGVTAALAAAAELKVSLTKRGEARSLTLLTPKVGAQFKDSDWLACAKHADTLAVYMARDEASRVAQALLGEGVAPETPVVVVVNASRDEENQRIAMTLEALSSRTDLHWTAPALILIGQVFKAAR